MPGRHIFKILVLLLMLMERIAAVDPNPIVDQRTYEGGCGFLLSWYKDHISNNNWLVNIVNHI